jgi:hypothetical protein
MITESILGIILAALKIWQSKDARKYIDEYTEILNLYRIEENKPDDERDDNKMDRLEIRFDDVNKALALDMGKPI